MKSKGLWIKLGLVAIIFIVIVFIIIASTRTILPLMLTAHVYTPKAIDSTCTHPTLFLKSKHDKETLTLACDPGIFKKAIQDITEKPNVALPYIETLPPNKVRWLLGRLYLHNAPIYDDNIDIQLSKTLTHLFSQSMLVKLSPLNIIIYKGEGVPIVTTGEHSYPVTSCQSATLRAVTRESDIPIRDDGVATMIRVVGQNIIILSKLEEQKISYSNYQKVIVSQLHCLNQHSDSIKEFLHKVKFADAQSIANAKSWIRHRNKS